MWQTRERCGTEKFEEGKNFHLHETHYDIIVEVPPMVTVLGSSKNTPVQMCCVGDHFLGKSLPFVGPFSALLAPATLLLLVAVIYLHHVCIVLASDVCACSLLCLSISATCHQPCA